MDPYRIRIWFLESGQRSGAQKDPAEDFFFYMLIYYISGLDLKLSILIRVAPDPAFFISGRISGFVCRIYGWEKTVVVILLSSV